MMPSWFLLVLGIINTGNISLKVYTIYAPPEHPFGTVHETKADALAAEEHHDKKQ